MFGETTHDDMLFSMLKECKTLPVFLDHIFGFLKRRSDFYVIAENRDSPIGLPPGLAQTIVREMYMKYADSEEVSSSNTLGKQTTSSTFEPRASNISNDSSTCSNNPETQKTTSTFKEHSGNHQDPSKSYNGSCFDNYSWSQTYNEVDLCLRLPPNTRGRDLVINTTAKSLCIKLKGGDIFLEGELCQACKLDPVWSIDQNELMLHLEKSKEIWWDCFLTTEPKLDVSKIECTKPLEDLSEYAQAKIQELQWNQEQKRLGLPTSDQINSNKIMKKAWDAPGSPFSGPFDPSAFSLN